MSPSWRERLCIELGPRRVALAFLPRGFGTAARARRVETCAAGGANGWRAAIDALDEGLRGRPCRGAAATVVLSGAFTRYQVVPWREGLSPAEHGALVRHGYERVFGPVAAQWELRASDAGYGLPAMACAVDRDLVAALAVSAARHGVRLVSVQPGLMWAFNRWRRALAGDTFCLVLGEDGHVCVAIAASGRWLAARGAALGGGDAQRRIAELVERELCLVALDPAAVPVYVHAPDLPGFHLASDRLPRVVALGTSTSNVPARASGGRIALTERR